MASSLLSRKDTPNCRRRCSHSCERKSKTCNKKGACNNSHSIQTFRLFQECKPSARLLTASIISHGDNQVNWCVPLAPLHNGFAARLGKIDHEARTHS